MHANERESRVPGEIQPGESRGQTTLGEKKAERWNHEISCQPDNLLGEEGVVLNPVPKNREFFLRTRETRTKNCGSNPKRPERFEPGSKELGKKTKESATQLL